MRNKDVPIAEQTQQEACEKFENISKLAKQGKKIAFIC
jgi:hypothetical protein